MLHQALGIGGIGRCCSGFCRGRFAVALERRQAANASPPPLGRAAGAVAAWQHHIAQADGPAGGQQRVGLRKPKWRLAAQNSSIVTSTKCDLHAPAAVCHLLMISDPAVAGAGLPKISMFFRGRLLFRGESPVHVLNQAAEVQELVAPLRFLATTAAFLPGQSCGQLGRMPGPASSCVCSIARYAPTANNVAASLPIGPAGRQ